MSKNILVLLLLTLIIGWFYWFQWRPASIRSFCHDQAIEAARSALKIKSELSGNDEYEDVIKKEGYLKEDYKSSYENCLHEKGLK